ncbi:MULTISPECIES: LysR family transcriptional regulator [unclassified Aeromicrobium]|uniref:LysR family transcriptional regulator n=1 Tax=unclassified Aeromicrobium TaxID=2633570 RepID=UPI00396B3302
MDLRRLALLRELERRGTIASVAAAMSFSHSSVSVQLATLEREAGVPLLKRVGRNVELTPAGRRLSEYATAALAADEAVRAELAALRGELTGRVRMTFVQTPALALLPRTLERLAQVAPHVELDVFQRETGPSLEDLSSQAVDLVVGVEYDPLPVGRHAAHHRVDLLREDMLLVLPRDHPCVAGDGPVRIAELENDVWASGHVGTGLDTFVANTCNRLGRFAPRVRHRSDDAIVLSALVESGRAVALLPAMFIADDAPPGVVARRPAEERLQRTLFSVARTSAHLTPAIEAVRDALRHTALDVATGRDDIDILVDRSS